MEDLVVAAGSTSVMPSETSIFTFIVFVSLTLFILLEVRFFWMRKRSGALQNFFSESVRDELAWASIPALVLFVLLVS